jgi:anti-anti-sigma regulatory factor
VLRIQKSQDGNTVTLVISGGLTDEYVSEVERVVEAEGRDGRLILDLEDVTHVSREGVRLLVLLEGSGVRLVSCPEYLRQWISRERK